MSRTPGPWALRGYQIRANNGTGKHVATYQISKADGILIAAAPEMFETLVRLLDPDDGRNPSSDDADAKELLRALRARLEKP